MSDVNKFTYLGDIISSDGRNSLNIQERVKKGTGLLCQITKIFQSINLGSFTIEIALLLRESILINGILTNAEIWFHLKSSEIENLEKVDRSLFHRLLRLPQTIPVPALYLETGTLPVAMIIKVRRLTYFHSILTGRKEGMLYRVFYVQWQYPNKGDWTLQVKNDLNDFNFPCDLDILEKYSKEKFKNIVKVRARVYSFNILNRKKLSYRKLENLNYSELKTQNYLLNNELDHDEKKIIFMFRTRMVNVGENFRSGKDFVMCPLCGLHLDSQFLLLQCPGLKDELVNYFGVGHQTSINEVFSEDISKSTVKILKFAVEIRKAKLE